MSLNPIRHITVDAADPLALARFWSEVTGYPVEDEPEDDEVLLEAPAGSPGLLFIRVPEPKTSKNRLHLDIQPVSGTRDTEVDRLIALGATLHEDHRRPSDGLGWVTLLDPEGNEFCIERSASERGLTT